METTVTEQTAPILGQILPLRRGGTKGDTAAPDGAAQPGGTVPLPVSPAADTVSPLSPGDRGRLAVAHWAEIAANGAGQLWLKPGRLPHDMWHGKPGSLAEHRAYIKSREWVPPDLDGKAATFIGGSGVVYHLLIARPLKAACLTVSAAADKPLRFAGLIATVLVFVIAVVPHIHVHI